MCSLKVNPLYQKLYNKEKHVREIQAHTDIPLTWQASSSVRNHPISLSSSCTVLCIHTPYIRMNPWILSHFLCDILHEHKSLAAVWGVEHPSGCALSLCAKELTQYLGLVVSMYILLDK